MRFFKLVALLALVACGGDNDPTSPGNSLAGTWSLQSINGTALPYVVLQSGANKIELTADILTVSSGGSFTQTSTIKTTVNGQVTTESVSDAGSYTVNGNAVSFVFNSDATTGTGVLSGNSLSVGAEGAAFIYRKQ